MLQRTHNTKRILEMLNEEINKKEKKLIEKINADKLKLKNLKKEMKEKEKLNKKKEKENKIKALGLGVLELIDQDVYQEKHIKKILVAGGAKQAVWKSFNLIKDIENVE